MIPLKKQFSGIRVGNILELITGLYTIILAIYPQPIWYIFALGIVPIISFAINIYSRGLGKKIKGGVEIVLITIIASYAYVILNISSNINVLEAPSIIGVLTLGLIIAILTFITRLIE